MRPIKVLVLAAALCGGCKSADRPKPPSFTDAMPNLPLPPNAQLVSRSGGADALELVFQSPAAPDVVADYYRHVFTTAPWQLVGDSKDPNGKVTTLYAEQTNHPMWVRIMAAGSVTRVEMTGAVTALDTAYAAKAKRAHDSTNTMVPRGR